MANKVDKPTKPEIPEALVPMRATPMQELIRQGILILPLTTAVIGSGMVYAMPEAVDYYVSMLPTLFIIGALVVTIAMVHQRRLYNFAIDLGEKLYEANTQLDNLHRLAMDLNQSRNPDEVALKILEHAVRAVSAETGALWFRMDEVIPPGEEGSETGIPRDSWVRLATTGFGERMPVHSLEQWESQLRSGHNFEACPNQRHILNVTAIQDCCPALESTFPLGTTSIVLPVMWKNEIVGCLLVAGRDKRFKREDTVMLSDVTLMAGPALQNAISYQAVAERAELDGLTRLYNHRALQERLAQEVARSHRNLRTNKDAKFAVATMDITDFKLFNDTYGHSTGDAVLRVVSDCLRQTVRASDVVGRYGGDEFVILLPETDDVGANVICQRAVDAIIARPFHAPDGSKISVLLSYGVAVLPDDASSAADLLGISDARLYVAKGRGKAVADMPIVPTSPVKNRKGPDWKAVGMLDALVTAIDNKDRFTRRHCERVWHYATLLALELELPPDLVQAVQICSLVQDVGKIIVPDSILRKPGRLTTDEVQIMQQHAVFGAMLVKDVPHLESVLNGVRYHHEWYDGSGYPSKLSGQAIPLVSRVLAVADCYAALISTRPFRKAMTADEALQVVVEGTNSQFDPVVVDALARVVAQPDNHSHDDADPLMISAPLAHESENGDQIGAHAAVVSDVA